MFDCSHCTKAFPNKGVKKSHVFNFHGLLYECILYGIKAHFPGLWTMDYLTDLLNLRTRHCNKHYPCDCFCQCYLSWLWMWHILFGHTSLESTHSTKTLSSTFRPQCLWWYLHQYIQWWWLL